MDNQPMQSSPPPPSSSNSSKTFLLIAGTIALMIISAAGGYFMGTRKNQKVVQNQQSTLSPTASQFSPTSDETVNWKTYTNTKYGYVIKYPQNWFIKDMTNQYNSSLVLHAIYINNNSAIDFGNWKVTATVINANLEEKDVKKFLDPKFTSSLISMEGSDSQYSIMKIYGKDALVTDTYEVKIDPQTKIQSKKGVQYSVRIPVEDKSLEILSRYEDKQTVNDIISTFKFTDRDQN